MNELIKNFSTLKNTSQVNILKLEICNYLKSQNKDYSIVLKINTIEQIKNLWLAIKQA